MEEHTVLHSKEDELQWMVSSGLRGEEIRLLSRFSTFLPSI